ncbi:MAG: TIGR02281 family clan AA aspartic protease [Litorimonas sp.]
MSQNIFLNAAIICACAVAGTAYLSYKSDQADTVQVQQDEKASKSQIAAKTVTKAPARPRKSGSTVTLQKDPRNGHFWTYARVNTGRVHFLVDTGASTIALTLNDAKKSGIKVRDLDFNIPVSTAGGTNYGAGITLESVTIGAITLRDIEAIIIKDGLSTSLLGMSYLGELQKVEATRDTLFLRL